MRSLRFSLLAALAFGLTLSACDNADPVSQTGNATATSTEDAAVSIANAISLDGGGALEVALEASGVATSDASKNDASGCIRERSFDEETTTWTRFIECERGRPEGLFYALFSRTGTYQFLDGDATTQYPADADAVNFDIIDGAGLRIRPGLTHELLDIGADLHVGDLHQELVTVNGDYNRAATDTLYTRNAERTLTYDVEMTLTDLVAIPGDRAHWRNAVSGTIEGTYHAIVTFMRGDAYGEREITKTFTIVFGESEGDVRDALITVDGQTFRADVETGEVAGVE